MNVLFFTSPTSGCFVRLGRCGGSSKGGEKWPPVKLMFAAGAVGGMADVKFLDAESRMTEAKFMESAAVSPPRVIVFEPAPGSIADDSAYIAKLKSRFPDAVSAAVGGFATAIAPEMLSAFESIDYVIDGEAELTLKEFVAAGASAAVRGMWFRDSGGPFFSGSRGFAQRLDELDFPSHDLIDKRIYRSPLVSRMPFTITESSRGCPYGCSFCNAHLMDGRAVRFRSIERLAEEMMLIKRHGFREVKFNDGTFTLNKERTLEFADMMRGMDLTWKCNTRADCLDGEILESISKAGCRAVFIGVESADPGILEYYGKDVSLERAAEAVRMAKKLKIKTVLHFIFGAPGETWDTIRASIGFALRADPDFVGFNILTPYPGTRIAGDLKARGLMASDDWSDFDQSRASAVRTERLGPGDLARAVVEANREFYFRPGYIAKRLAEMRNPASFSRYLRGLIGLLMNR